MAAKPSGHFKTITIILILWCGLTTQAQPFAGGAGEPNDPYLIYTAEQMNEIGRHPETWSSHFKLMADIDLSGYGNDGFHLIGTFYRPFSGVFDGHGHTVSGFTCISSEREDIGLFVAIGSYEGYFGATIKNLGLIDPNVTGSAALEAAGLAAIVFRGTIANCYVRGGRVEGSNNAGGLVGSNAFGHIVNCYASAAVRGSVYAGGLVGYNDRGMIATSYAAGRVAGNENLGGLVCAGVGSVFQSFWDVEITGQTSSAGGEGRTTAEMQAAGTYAGWAYTDEGMWTIDDGHDYPRLGWEGRPGRSLASAELADWLGGAGTREDPLLVHTAEEFNLIGWFPRDWGKHFRLMADIDLSPYATTGFNPIGYYWDHAINRPFTGVFDGGGHVILRATYDSQHAGSLAMPLMANGNLGLFGYVNDPNATIRSLGLIAPEVDANNLSNVGALVGCLDRGTVMNCFVQAGHVSGDESVGGLVGVNLSGTVEDCHAAVAAEGTWAVGGLVGENQGTIRDCLADGRTTGGHCVGGLVGHNREGICSDCGSTAVASGDGMVGGLVGYNQGAIGGSYSRATVSGGEDVGGLVGYSLGSVQDCYSLATVSGDTAVGGLIGSHSWRPRYPDATIRHCLSAGPVIGNVNVGGLMGHSWTGEALQSFWDVETSGRPDSAAGTGKTTTQLQTETTFTDAGWDFETIWAICEEQGYPHLQWEGIGCEP